jgi:hypothetical protein
MVTCLHITTNDKDSKIVNKPQIVALLCFQIVCPFLLVPLFLPLNDIRRRFYFSALIVICKQVTIVKIRIFG